jgi:biotin carboxyl carrier protein
MSVRTLTLVRDDQEQRVDVLADGRVRVGEHVFTIQRDGTGGFRIAGETATTAWSVMAGDVRWVFLNGRAYQFSEARRASRRGRSQYGTLTAPMPASVRRVLVKAGDLVKRGDLLIVLEAMKMELPVRATAAGTIKEVRCREGDLVQPGVLLIDVHES